MLQFGERVLHVPCGQELTNLLKYYFTYCPNSVLSKSVDPGTYFPAARLISLLAWKKIHFIFFVH